MTSEIYIPYSSLNYEGPILAPYHRALSARKVANCLLEKAAGKPLDDPETWLEIAGKLNIRLEPFPGYHTSSRGGLSYIRRRDQWTLEYNTSFSKLEQCESLVHELAHWYLRTADPQWLCDEPIVYWYEGPVQTEHHKIARAVEWRVLGRAVRPFWRRRKRDGLE